MRLWHYRLVPHLPRPQLLAQWRELNSIFVNQPRHILINYVYECGKYNLEVYTNIVLNEMRIRGYRVSDKSLENFKSYFGTAPRHLADTHEELVEFVDKRKIPMFRGRHDKTYLEICYYNLLEKYIRGQKDFSEQEMRAIAKCAGKEMPE